MIRAMWIAASGMEAQQLNVDVISNNLANVNTTGFKRSRADFQDLLYQTLRQPGVASSSSTQVPTGMQLGQGTRPVAIQKIFIQGDYQQTQNELDIAVRKHYRSILSDVTSNLPGLRNAFIHQFCFLRMRLRRNSLAST